MHYDAESGLFLPRSRKALHERRLLEVKHQQLLMANAAPNDPAGLDPYTNELWFVGGLKRLLSSYPQASPLLRVRRSSDNAEMDVYAVSSTNPVYNITAILAWSGADSVFVVKVHDQVPLSANYFSAASNAAQPRIVNAGTPDTFIRTDNTDDLLVTAIAAPSTTQFHVGMTAQSRTAGGFISQTNTFAASHKAWLLNSWTSNGYIFYMTASATAYDVVGTNPSLANTMAGFLARIGPDKFNIPLAVSVNGGGLGFMAADTNGGGSGAGAFTSEIVQIGQDVNFRSVVIYAGPTRREAANMDLITNVLNF